MKSLREFGTCVAALSAVLLSGCTCPENRKAGVPLITCQPVDQEVSLGVGSSQSASFHVGVREKDCRFEWYRLKLTPGGSVPASLAGQTGGRTDTLVLENVTEATRGFYYCEIVHEAAAGLGDVSSRTRIAELKVYPVRQLFMLSATGTVVTVQLSTQTLINNPAGGSAVCDLPSYLTSITYSKDDSGLKFHSPASSPATCRLSVSKATPGGDVPLTNTKWTAKWSLLTGAKTCVTTKPDTLARTFNVTQFNKDHYFVIYINDPVVVGDTFKLRVEFLVP